MSNNELNKYYKILGLKPGASLLEIKRAYRNLVKTEHPDLFDRNPQQKRAAEEKFRQITEAYIKLKKFDRLESPNQTFNSSPHRSTTTSRTPNQTASSRTRSTASSRTPNQTTSSSDTRSTTTPRTPNQTASSRTRNSILSNLSPYLRSILPIAIGVNVIFLVYMGLNNSNFQNSNSRPQIDSSPQNPLPQPSFSPQPIPHPETASVSVPSQECRVVVPTIGNSARVFTQPSRSADTGKRIAQDTKVSFISGVREFVEIKLADGTSGWVFNDQVYPCKIRSDSRAQIASISEQPQQCLAIAPTAGRGARIFSQPSRNAYIGRRIPQDTKVSLLGDLREFVEIRLADGTSGWVFNDQVHPCTVSYLPHLY